ncbi:WXG100 family type VII secretion target [Leekyejoonella antrihumi]|uniref:Uncharacterized protein n=1 Tax=Leekyejoonella antrihumi TaxID=1660198 RepID=A0A563DVS4_9MICO|nr:hypothetical protein [Leekyejoonella antrihumi]TWP34370.1 hypothetical protein FGL98_17465 [Leekyejoonella antrihumi]
MTEPISGDPPDLLRAAGLLSRAADEVGSREQALRQGATVGTTGWLGPAAVTFGAAAGEHAGRLVRARRALGSIGVAVRGYALVLEGLQTQESTLLARRGALTQRLRIAALQQGITPVAVAMPEDRVEQIVAQLRRVDAELDDIRQQASTAQRALTATIDDLAPTRSPRAVPRRPLGLTTAVLADLTDGGTSAVGAVWTHPFPKVPASAATGRMHCGPVRPVLTDPSGRVTTGPVGQQVGAGHRMRTGPVRPVLVDPTRRMRTGPVRRMP